MGFLLFYSASLGPFVWAFIAEVLPAAGVSIVVSVDWMGLAMNSYIYKPLVNAFGPCVPFWIFGTLNFCVS
jgi:hypothetical protein